ncbi:hypothetical protein A1O3_00930 [Capronia epimyces CBS 606.96]|uniref:Chromatin modification-related protein EAF3 n=1 Tax=Capronia epimyces CBS 606.96 TaxID=1182542 RepID=W9YRX0_9EURO|nr:uncharacterized protein A1O3_00930 [Capronia epimyces CBS 606.96]EXJ92380.1 hypothetical protein A1O3_00930 [Capronia epimyces CBS 606.96]
MAPQSSESKPMYQKDEKALCFHGELLYEAKVLDVRRQDAKDKTSPHEYRVHYKGWKNTWDDWVPQDRLRKLTDDNRELAANLRRELTASAPKVVPKSTTKTRRGQGSEIGSGRGSEERTSSVPAASGRGSKRARDNDIEKFGSMASKKKNSPISADMDTHSGNGLKRRWSGLSEDGANNKEVGKEIDLQQFLHQPRRAAVKAAQAISNTASNKAPAVGGSVDHATDKRKSTANKMSAPPITRSVEHISKNRKTTGESKPQSANSNPAKAGTAKRPTGSLTGHNHRGQGSSAVSRRESVVLTPSTGAKHKRETREEIPDSDEEVDPTVGRSVTGKAADGSNARPVKHSHKLTLKLKLKPKPKSESATVRPSNSSSSKAIKKPVGSSKSTMNSSSSSKTPDPLTYEELVKSLPDPRDELASLSIDEILARPAPPDEPEYMSLQTSSERRQRNAPLIGGTTTDEKHRITEELLAAQGAGRAHRYRPAVVPKHGVAVTPLDPPGSGTPFDALRDEDRLVNALNHKTVETLGGWNQEALLKIPVHVMHRLDAPALVRLPYAVLKAQPESVVHKLPEDCWFWEECRRDWLREECRQATNALDDPEAEPEPEPLLHTGLPPTQTTRPSLGPATFRRTNAVMQPTVPTKNKPVYRYLDWTMLFTSCGNDILYAAERTHAYNSPSEQEENYLNRPSIRISIPDHLKNLLVDDWENVTKSLLLVPLPSQAPANYILDEYFNEEKLNRRLGSVEADILEEFVTGLKTYFEKAVGKILLYRFERNQLQDVRKLWESGKYKDWEGKGPGDCYGAEHLTRLIVNLPEIVAQTNMDAESVTRLKLELSKFTTWLSRNSQRFFCAKYEKPSAEYVEGAR